MNTVKCKNCKHYRNEWCDKIVDSPDPELERMCGSFSQITNGFVLRKMTDDELGSYLCSLINCNDCTGKQLCCYGDGHGNGLIKWLKSYTEVGKQ